MLAMIGLVAIVTILGGAAIYSPAAASQLVLLTQLMTTFIINYKLGKWEDREFNRRKLKVIKNSKIAFIVFMSISMLISGVKCSYYLAVIFYQLMR